MGPWQTPGTGQTMLAGSPSPTTQSAISTSTNTDTCAEDDFNKHYFVFVYYSFNKEYVLCLFPNWLRTSRKYQIMFVLTSIIKKNYELS